MSFTWNSELFTKGYFRLGISYCEAINEQTGKQLEILNIGLLFFDIDIIFEK